jgi:hypothetical protein
MSSRTCDLNSITPTVQAIFAMHNWDHGIREYPANLLTRLVSKLDVDPMLTETGHNHLVVRRVEPQIYEVLISLRPLENANRHDHGTLPGYTKGSGTSREAAERVKSGKLSERQQLVLKILRDAGARGLIDEEVEKMCPDTWGATTARKRRGDLTKGKLVIRTKEKRKTRTDCNAHVYVATEHFPAWQQRYRLIEGENGDGSNPN